MIATAMIIAVIGQHNPTQQLNYMPWEIDILDNGNTRVFGVTLNKTSVQEANQIFANFADTRLLINHQKTDTPDFKLIACYDELTIGGLIAEMHLSYQLDQATLRQLYQSSTQENPDSPKGFITLNKHDEMKFLNTPVSNITYIPSIDYGEEVLRQRFGQAAEETTISKTTQRWFYPELGLTILLHQDQPDEFIYSTLQ